MDISCNGAKIFCWFVLLIVLKVSPNALPWILEYFVVYLLCVYIYVRLVTTYCSVVSTSFDAWCITCCPKLLTSTFFFCTKLKNVSCEYDRLNGWNSTLQAAWYIRHVRWTCLFYTLSISFTKCFLWTKPTIWLLIQGFTRQNVRAGFFVLSLWRV